VEGEESFIAEEYRLSELEIIKLSIRVRIPVGLDIFTVQARPLLE
jgi:hypothetical protein